ncbi:MAG: tetraacyldisaccharide 4'-kinase [Deltaproteobacteria bacterium]|jgi:tetraacyldisaccharide 4'-kinase|nr:tetraacyldisaccharide 4'-kinase [Deltaproteobacteria bacterium]
MLSDELWNKDRQASPVTGVLAAAYGLAAGARRLAYQKGLFGREKAPLPVVSVGNLTVGGNAKTPMCVYLANEFLKKGLVPAVLSRGYGRKKSRFRPDPLTVSLGLGPLAPPEHAGDEPHLIASLTRAMVFVSGKRIRAAREAARQGARILILDDGFQHLSIQRDLDILMFRADNPLGNGRLLPAGPLREPLRAAAAADLFVSAGAGGVPPAVRRLAGGRPLFSAELKGGRLASLKDSTPLEAASLKGRRLAAFCGVADPGSFKNTLNSLGLTPVAFLAFPDHEPYLPKARGELERLLKFSRSEFLLTTRKDAVKLKDLDLPVLVLDVELVPNEPEKFLQAVFQKLSLA